LQKENYKIPEIGKAELDYMTQELTGKYADQLTSILTNPDQTGYLIWLFTFKGSYNDLCHV
jgi:hypothetical protein